MMNADQESGKVNGVAKPCSACCSTSRSRGRLSSGTRTGDWRTDTLSLFASIIFCGFIRVHLWPKTLCGICPFSRATSRMTTRKARLTLRHAEPRPFPCRSARFRGQRPPSRILWKSPGRVRSTSCPSNRMFAPFGSRRRCAKMRHFAQRRRKRAHRAAPRSC